MDNKYFDFDNVRILPKKGIVESRDDCNSNITFGNRIFKLGVVPANMLCSINEELSEKLATAGYFYIHHRFNHNNINFVRKMNEKNIFSSISVGVNEESYHQIKQIKSEKLRIEYITVDIAHGHCTKMERMVKFLKDEFQNDCFIIGGNVCTPDAVEDLSKWGCDAIKAGIGPGAACTTYLSTNVGSKGWQASMIQNLNNAPVPIICDGGIRSVGHICVSFAMGATMTMVGSLFSRIY
jgi:GMP reductase